MSAKRITLILTIVACLSTIMWVGCSDNNSTFNSAGQVTSTGMAAYFPSDEGYTTLYQVTYSNGSTEEVRYETGGEVQLPGVAATQLFCRNGAGYLDTVFIQYTSNAIYHYANVSSSPEKILELPLTLGQTWDRYSYDEETENDTIDITIDPDSNKADDTTSTGDEDFIDDNPLLTFPLTSTNTMTSMGYESVELSTGESYSSALKVIATGNSGQTDYYWYVPGIGLVKYVLSATTYGTIEGETVGELISNGF